MADSTQDFKELNRKAWNKEAVPRFELPEFKALSKLSVLKYLTIGSNGQSASLSDKEAYTVDEINKSCVENRSIKAKEEASALGNKVNTDIWCIFDKDDKGTSEEPLEILDFACGPGNVTLALLDSLPLEKSYRITGIDLSEDFVDAYNKRVDFPNVHAEALDILGKEDVLKNRKFDIAVCTMSLHHISDLELLCKRIATHLKKGGWFLAMDFDGHAIFSGKEAVKRGIAHSTLEPEKITNLFEKAGLSQILVERGFRLEYSKEQKLTIAQRKEVNPEEHHPDLGKKKLCIVAGRK
ncbi:hypothetical protein BRETT_005304 [Brettanomyces bruxellensis]|uniref:Methyltransferase domain-containing protein n=1 Tax=Dekkera bruxellensis TaxID=5007 RepID=A0A871R520_DEKBR|nr:uncharacterized protein BRETT_005304 [Brettanomyces bruxellensis]QOU18242.1 hypothetical protein BRETT_005304 [Brettanomyces bruxellensis]